MSNFSILLSIMSLLMQRAIIYHLCEVISFLTVVCDSSSGCAFLLQVVGAYFEKLGSKSFAVYSIAVTDADNKTWFVKRRHAFTGIFVEF